MINGIDAIEARPDVEKTEYTRRKNGNTVIVELWHDREGLQSLFEQSLEATLSERGMLEHGREQALAVRETTIKRRPLDELHPNLTEYLEEQYDEENDYEYNVR